MVAWWQSLSLETLTRLNSLMVGFTALAALAVSVGGVLIWLSSNRMEQLKNEAELKAHAERVTTEADLRAQIKDAEVRAGAATQKAEEAHELANRQTPRALSGDLMSQAVALLRQWVTRHRETSLNIVLVGVGEPSVDHVAAVVSQLLRQAAVPIGSTRTIGVASGLPRGAIILASRDRHAEAAELAAALQPVIANIEARVQDGAHLTLHLNGRPSFRSTGAFVVE